MSQRKCSIAGLTVMDFSLIRKLCEDDEADYEYIATMNTFVWPPKNRKII